MRAPVLHPMRDIFIQNVERRARICTCSTSSKRDAGHLGAVRRIGIELFSLVVVPTEISSVVHIFRVAIRRQTVGCIQAGSTAA